VTAGRRVWFRDVEYLGLGLVAELDGRLGHESFDDRAKDMTRDNQVSVERRRSLRVGYRHTMSEACDTAVVVIEILRQNGWRGVPRPCGPGCPVADLPAASGESLPAASGEILPAASGEIPPAASGEILPPDSEGGVSPAA
jgi:hypothetical protein